MLTQEDLQILQRPFAYEDHEFIRGYVYIREGAITQRIEEVDPAWSFGHVETTIVDGQYNVTSRLAIKGVTRVGTGTAEAIEKNGRLVNEPLKSAATDSLKRAARLFGIGRYLLQAPHERDFKRWLASLTGETPAPRQTTPNNERRVDPVYNVNLLRAKKGITEGRTQAKPKYKFIFAFDNGTEAVTEIPTWQFLEWTGLESLKDISSFENDVYTLIHPLPAKVKKSGELWILQPLDKVTS